MTASGRERSKQSHPSNRGWAAVTVTPDEDRKLTDEEFGDSEEDDAFDAEDEG